MEKDTQQEISQSSIRETLNRIGAISDKRVELLSSKTRDNPKLNVYRDSVSNVIFIDDYYVGDDEYVSGEYRKQPKPLTKTLGRDYEDITDSERRFKAYRQFITAKDICDFGCGGRGNLYGRILHAHVFLCGRTRLQGGGYRSFKTGQKCFDHDRLFSHSSFFLGSLFTSLARFAIFAGFPPFPITQAHPWQRRDPDIG